jgi:hypothetical protein
LKSLELSDIDRRLSGVECQIDRITGITVKRVRDRCIMPALALEKLELNLPLYSRAELVEHRRNILRYARSCPPGPERNQHRQVARSLRTLFRNRAWLQANVLKEA